MQHTLQRLESDKISFARMLFDALSRLTSKPWHPVITDKSMYSAGLLTHGSLCPSLDPDQID
jgi:hypothetical protein